MAKVNRDSGYTGVKERKERVVTEGSALESLADFLTKEERMAEIAGTAAAAAYKPINLHEDVLFDIVNYDNAITTGAEIRRSFTDEYYRRTE